MNKLVVIGIDGGNWEFIEPWIVEGKLPHIKYLKENGVWANSISQLPTVTCPNWKCYTTGKNPGKLGVFWWQCVDKEKKRLVGFNSSSFKSLEIFDYMGARNFRVGVINTPLTYPPKKVNGFMISGHPVPQEKNYTYPPSLEQELKQKYNYRVNPKGNIATELLKETVEEIHNLIRLRFQVARDLIEEVDFLQISLFYINVLQHFLFNESSTLKGWEIIDENIGYFINEGYNIILMSDHGTHKIDRLFYKNVWLEKEGYLKLKKVPADILGNVLRKLGITGEKLICLANKLRIDNFLKNRLPQKVYGWIPTSSGVILRNTWIPEQKIDWENSKALATGQGSIYILIDRNKEEYATIRDEIVEKLKKLRTDNNRNVAKRVYKCEEFYTGKYLNLAPDIIYEQGRSVYSVGGIGGDRIFATPEKWKGENLREGIFLAYGNDIKNGEKLEDMSILDIAPTILQWLNIPVPKDMDGRVLKEIFKENSDPKIRAIDYEDINEKTVIKKRIKELKKRTKI